MEQVVPGFAAGTNRSGFSIICGQQVLIVRMINALFGTGSANFLDGQNAMCGCVYMFAD